MKIFLSFCLIMLLAAVPAYAQSVEELQQQLDAQKQMNELLKQRVRTLEKQLADKGGARLSMGQTSASQPAPKRESGDPEENRALERALERRGLSVLPFGTWELTPGFVYGHSGSEANRSNMDYYAGTIDLRVGLPFSSMFGIGIPYYFKSENAWGDDNGFGDLHMQLWKQILSQSDTIPSVVGSIAYYAPTAEESDVSGLLGSEFHRLRANLNASKSFDPLVLYGDIFYSYAFEKNISGIDYQPGDYYGARAGTQLAISPDITGNVALSFFYVNEMEANGNKIDGTQQTIGYLEMGVGFVLGSRTYLSINADIGITDDAPDVVLSVSLPIRF